MWVVFFFAYMCVAPVNQSLASTAEDRPEVRVACVL